MCSHDFFSKTTCSITTYEKNLEFYSHLSNSNQGGDSHQDYCTFPSEDVTISCKDTSQAASSSTGEIYGKNSACFHSTSINSMAILSFSSLRCHNYNCTAIKGLFSLQSNLNFYYKKLYYMGEILQFLVQKNKI
jgi:hypothetical protein